MQTKNTRDLIMGFSQLCLRLRLQSSCSTFLLFKLRIYKLQLVFKYYGLVYKTTLNCTAGDFASRTTSVVFQSRDLSICQWSMSHTHQVFLEVFSTQSQLYWYNASPQAWKFCGFLPEKSAVILFLIIYHGIVWGLCSYIWFLLFCACTGLKAEAMTLFFEILFKIHSTVILSLYWKCFILCQLVVGLNS